MLLNRKKVIHQNVLSSIMIIFQFINKMINYLNHLEKELKEVYIKLLKDS